MDAEHVRCKLLFTQALHATQVAGTPLPSALQAKLNFTVEDYIDPATGELTPDPWVDVLVQETNKVCHGHSTVCCRAAVRLLHT